MICRTFDGCDLLGLLERLQNKNKHSYYIASYYGKLAVY